MARKKTKPITTVDFAKPASKSPDQPSPAPEMELAPPATSQPEPDRSSTPPAPEPASLTCPHCHQSFLQANIQAYRDHVEGCASEHVSEGDSPTDQLSTPPHSATEGLPTPYVSGEMETYPTVHEDDTDAEDTPRATWLGAKLTPISEFERSLEEAENLPLAQHQERLANAHKALVQYQKGWFSAEKRAKTLGLPPTMSIEEEMATQGGRGRGYPRDPIKPTQRVINPMAKPVRSDDPEKWNQYHQFQLEQDRIEGSAYGYGVKENWKDIGHQDPISQRPRGPGQARDLRVRQPQRNAVGDEDSGDESGLNAVNDALVEGGRGKREKRPSTRVVAANSRASSIDPRAKAPRQNAKSRLAELQADPSAAETLDSTQHWVDDVDEAEHQQLEDSEATDDAGIVKPHKGPTSSYLDQPKLKKTATGKKSKKNAANTSIMSELDGEEALAAQRARSDKRSQGAKMGWAKRKEALAAQHSLQSSVNGDVVVEGSQSELAKREPNDASDSNSAIKAAPKKKQKPLMQLEDGTWIEKPSAATINMRRRWQKKREAEAKGLPPPKIGRYKKIDVPNMPESSSTLAGFNDHNDQVLAAVDRAASNKRKQAGGNDTEQTSHNDQQADADVKPGKDSHKRHKKTQELSDGMFQSNNLTVYSMRMGAGDDDPMRFPPPSSKKKKRDASEELSGPPHKKKNQQRNAESLASSNEEDEVTDDEDPNNPTSSPTKRTKTGGPEKGTDKKTKKNNKGTHQSRQAAARSPPAGRGPRLGSFFRPAVASNLQMSAPPIFNDTSLPAPPDLDESESEGEETSDEGVAKAQLIPGSAQQRPSGFVEPPRRPLLGSSSSQPKRQRTWKDVLRAGKYFGLRPGLRQLPGINDPFDVPKLRRPDTKDTRPFVPPNTPENFPQPLNMPSKNKPGKGAANDRRRGGGASKSRGGGSKKRSRGDVVSKPGRGVPKDAGGYDVATKPDRGVPKDAVGYDVAPRPNRGVTKDAVGYDVTSKPDRGVPKDGGGYDVDSKPRRGLFSSKQSVKSVPVDRPGEKRVEAPKPSEDLPGVRRSDRARRGPERDPAEEDFTEDYDVPESFLSRSMRPSSRPTRRAPHGHAGTFGSSNNEVADNGAERPVFENDVAMVSQVLDSVEDAVDLDVQRAIMEASRVQTSPPENAPRHRLDFPPLPPDSASDRARAAALDAQAAPAAPVSSAGPTPAPELANQDPSGDNSNSAAAANQGDTTDKKWGGIWKGGWTYTDKAAEFDTLPKLGRNGLPLDPSAIDLNAPRARRDRHKPDQTSSAEVGQSPAARPPKRPLNSSASGTTKRPRTRGPTPQFSREGSQTLSIRTASPAPSVSFPNIFRTAATPTEADRRVSAETEKTSASKASGNNGKSKAKANPAETAEFTEAAASDPTPSNETPEPTSEPPAEQESVTGSGGRPKRKIKPPLKYEDEVGEIAEEQRERTPSGNNKPGNGKASENTKRVKDLLGDPSNRMRMADGSVQRLNASSALHFASGNDMAHATRDLTSATTKTHNKAKQPKNSNTAKPASNTEADSPVASIEENEDDMDSSQKTVVDPEVAEALAKREAARQAKSEKMKAITKARWASGEMHSVMEKKKANNALKKAAQAAGTVTPIAIAPAPLALAPAPPKPVSHKKNTSASRSPAVSDNTPITPTLGGFSKLKGKAIIKPEPKKESRTKVLAKQEGGSSRRSARASSIELDDSSEDQPGSAKPKKLTAYEIFQQLSSSTNHEDSDGVKGTRAMSLAVGYEGRRSGRGTSLGGVGMQRGESDEGLSRSIQRSKTVPKKLSQYEVFQQIISSPSAAGSPLPRGRRPAALRATQTFGRFAEDDDEEVEEETIPYAGPPGHIGGHGRTDSADTSRSAKKDNGTGKSKTKVAPKVKVEREESDSEETESDDARPKKMTKYDEWQRIMSGAAEAGDEEEGGRRRGRKSDLGAPAK